MVDSAFGQEQPLRDLGIRQVLGHQIENLEPASREPMRITPRCRARAARDLARTKPPQHRLGGRGGGFGAQSVEDLQRLAEILLVAFHQADRGVVPAAEEFEVAGCRTRIRERIPKGAVANAR